MRVSAVLDDTNWRHDDGTRSLFGDQGKGVPEALIGV